jgi:hypothetical protein
VESLPLSSRGPSALYFAASWCSWCVACCCFGTPLVCLTDFLFALQAISVARLVFSHPGDETRSKAGSSDMYERRGVEMKGRGANIVGAFCLCLSTGPRPSDLVPDLALPSSVIQATLWLAAHRARRPCMARPPPGLNAPSLPPARSGSKPSRGNVGPWRVRSLSWRQRRARQPGALTLRYPWGNYV